MLTQPACGKYPNLGPSAGCQAERSERPDSHQDGVMTEAGGRKASGEVPVTHFPMQGWRVAEFIPTQGDFGLISHWFHFSLKRDSSRSRPIDIEHPLRPNTVLEDCWERKIPDLLSHSTANEEDGWSHNNTQVGGWLPWGCGIRYAGPSWMEHVQRGSHV